MTGQAKENAVRKFPRERDSIGRIRDFVHAQGTLFGLSDEQGRKLALIMEELAVNAISYDGGNSAPLVVEMENHADSVCLTFIESGNRFNPLEQPDPDTTSDLASRQIGGLGIFMVKQLADRIEYSWENGSNIIRIIMNRTG